MKTKLLSILFILGASGSSELLAQETERPFERPRPSREQMRERLVQHFDKNGDGMLNEQERQAARVAMQARRQEMQNRRRGQPEGEQVQRRRGQPEGEQPEGEQAQRRGRAGQQGQGFRGQEQGPPPQSLGRQRGNQGQARQRPSQEERRAGILQQFDANGDGQLDEFERATLKEAMEKRRAQSGQERPTREARRGRGPQERESANAPRSDRRQCPR
ncbi:MAG: hypothetical protein O3A95_02575 [Planctomycetota bacterium]|nr:hypothetical protein [Planctomycetota bacterium]MDA1113168.1 hypothetical protein [Planctomycetota bacterium]